MSVRKLEKNYRGDPRSHDNLSITPIIIGDSKVKYLKPFSQNKKIIWICKSGANSSKIFTWVHKNLRKLLRKHNYLSLYLFCGTCDFTEKKGRYIDLARNQQSVLQRFCGNLRGIKDICVRSGRVTLTFLQVPYYSIQNWNCTKGHPDPKSFKDNDKFLTEQIDEANRFVKTLNSSVNSYSPNLNADLSRSRKRKKGKARYSWNFKLYKDGVHPDSKLARSWCTSVYRKIRKDCV